MKKELIKLANHLDRMGLTKEADYLDNIIKEGGESSLFSCPEKAGCFYEVEEDGKSLVVKYKTDVPLKDRKTVAEFILKKTTGFDRRIPAGYHRPSKKEMEDINSKWWNYRFSLAKDKITEKFKDLRVWTSEECDKEKGEKVDLGHCKIQIELGDGSLKRYVSASDFSGLSIFIKD